MKKLELKYGNDVLYLSIPESARRLTLPSSSPLRDPAGSIRRSLCDPIGAGNLQALIGERKKNNPDARAAVVVSDNTRPVPYVGEQGILEPILDVLAGQGIRHIEILVANGTHRVLAGNELRSFLPRRVFESGIPVINHECIDESSLTHLGRTSRGSEACINKRYLDADIKILTGLVEPHFMAGVSGGRKSICPGLAGEALTHIFHGAGMMADERADSFMVDGNPCHEEAVEVALMAGADFIINVTLDRERRLTGVYSGDMIQAHAAAAARVTRENAIPLSHEYDLVVTHAGFVGVNHYQTAKACVEAAKAVRPGGYLVVVADHTDPDPVGSENYKRVLPLLEQLGPEGLASALLDPGWKFVPDQWEVQMWARVIRKLSSSAHLVYCAPRLTGDPFKKHGLPGTDGGQDIPGLAGRECAESMAQRAIDRFLAEYPGGSVAVLADGPYGVPSWV